METMTEIATWVRDVRVQTLGLTQDEFAALLGVSVRSVANWELGTTEPTVLAFRLLERLAEDRGLPAPPMIDRRRGPVGRAA